METDTARTTTERNSFLVHPLTTEPGAQNQCTLPPQCRLPQFSAASSRILSRIKGNNVAPQKSGVGSQSDTSKIDDALHDEFTLLLLPESSYAASAPPVEYVYANDDSFETADVDFAQQSIPFRPPYEPIEKPDAVADAPGAPNREETIETQRRVWLGTLPEGVRPAKPELVGFSAGPEALASALTSYFYGIPKTDLLNILSFCDQLEPQLLVDLLVSISKRHPNLPLFDAPDWQDKVLAQEAARAAAAQMRVRAHQRPRHGHTLLNPRMRQKRKRVRKVVEISTTATEAASGGTVLLQDIESEDEELLPPTWPKAGEGLYATLPPEDQDSLYLADEGDDEAFGHFMVDGLGNLTALTVCG